MSECHIRCLSISCAPYNGWCRWRKNVKYVTKSIENTYYLFHCFQFFVLLQKEPKISFATLDLHNRTYSVFFFCSKMLIPPFTIRKRNTNDVVFFIECKVCYWILSWVILPANGNFSSALIYLTFMLVFDMICVLVIARHCL